jgi:neurotransmitter:Na+ symporter, NSS family
LGWWWLLALGAVTPLVLGWMMVDNLRLELAAPYGGYPLSFLVVFGWGLAGMALVAGLLLARVPWPDTTDTSSPPARALGDDPTRRSEGTP